MGSQPQCLRYHRHPGDFPYHPTLVNSVGLDAEFVVLLIAHVECCGIPHERTEMGQGAGRQIRNVWVERNRHEHPARQKYVAVRLARLCG